MSEPALDSPMTCAVCENVTRTAWIAGRAMVFPSYTLHRVTPIASGVRKSLVAWVAGPQFR